MSTYILIKNGVAVNKILADEDFIEKIRDEYDSIELVQDVMVAPEQPIPQARTVFNPIEFMMLFTSAERVAVRALRATDPIVDDWMSIIQDPRLTQIDLKLTSTRDFLSHLVSVTVLTGARKEQILAGVAQ